VSSSSDAAATREEGEEKRGVLEIKPNVIICNVCYKRLEHVYVGKDWVPKTSFRIVCFDCANSKQFDDIMRMLGKV